MIITTTLRSLGLVSIAAWTLLGCSGAQAPTAAPALKAEPAIAPTPPDARYDQLPLPTIAPNWAPPAAHRTALSNGLSVWHMKHGAAPLVSIHLMLPTGTAADPKTKSGLTLLTADLLDEGAGKRNALELSDRLGELATDYASSAGVDYVLLSMDALAENLEPSLELLADIVLRPKLLKEEFERRKQHHLATALTTHDDQEESRQRAIERALFGQGYAGAPPTGTKATLEAITLSDVTRQAKSLAVPDGAHLTIAGLADESLVLAAVNKAFGGWKGKRTARVPAVEPATPGRRAFVTDFPGAAQSSIAIVTRAGKDEDPNFFPEEVMNEKVGKSFTSRINMNLRESKGYTYGAFSMFRRYQQAGYFAVMSNVRSEVTAASVKEVLGELAALCNDRPLSTSELNESIEGLLLGFPIQFDEVSAVGMRLVALPVHKRPDDFWKAWPSNIKAVTLAQANAAAAPYCTPDRYSVVVSGDAKTVVPGLTALGYEVSEVDRDGNPLAASSKSAPAQAATELPKKSN